MKVLGRNRPVEAESSVQMQQQNLVILNENLDLFADINNIIQVSNLTKLQD